MDDQASPPIDPVLDTLEAIAAYLAAAFESGDAERLTRALASVAQADGLAELAAATGLPRAQLAEALSAGEMSLETTLTLMKVIDLHQPSEGGNTLN
jgi:probable addiction module antidote protein